MGTESDLLEEKQTQVYCFQHIVFQEFTAGNFLITLDKVLQQLVTLIGNVSKSVILSIAV